MSNWPPSTRIVCPLPPSNIKGRELSILFTTEFRLVVNVGVHGDSFASDQAMTLGWCRLKWTASE